MDLHYRDSRGHLWKFPKADDSIVWTHMAGIPDDFVHYQVFVGDECLEGFQYMEQANRFKQWLFAKIKEYDTVNVKVHVTIDNFKEWYLKNFKKEIVAC